MNDNPTKVYGIGDYHWSQEPNPFTPIPATPEDLIGWTIIEAEDHAGTYGMGGPGFFSLGLDNGKFFIVALWHAASWILLDGKPLDPDIRTEDENITKKYQDELNRNLRYLVGKRIEHYECHEKSMLIKLFNLSGEATLEIKEDPLSRPVWGGSGELKIIDGDLRDGCFMATSMSVWC